ncbi:MAG TPA: replication initiator, partial [Jatrophihabitantaceae bacterium]|nr:replication initiator [Jatrophihabitantaceae bacterium]
MTTTTDDVDSARAADAPVELAALTPEGIRQVTARLLSPDFPEWSAAAARVGHCSRPVLLRGRSHTINSTTGEVLASYDSGAEFDGLTR